ncbi:hypothetical protein ACFYW6_18005 [Streptomyces sp. NPDC002659]|uniref:hypothetical protein n=1 Tax=Streptomyces sp. NPDC002659 TaxID=3364656 RepID=UPI0036CBCAF7
MSSAPDFTTWLELQDDELYSIVGSDLLGESLGIGPSDPDRSADFGRQWFAARRRELQREVCGNPKVQQMVIHHNGDKLAECAAVFEILGDSGIHMGSAPVVAVLIVRLGLTTFCSGYSA